MEILHLTNENDEYNTLDIDQNRSPIIYLVDNELKMLIILKRDLKEISDDNPVQEFIRRKLRSLIDKVTIGCLSQREKEVLNYAALGKSNKQIADILELSESTVKHHVGLILDKLHANDRAHAVTLALCNGWLNIKDISDVIINEETNSQCAPSQ